MMSVCVPVDQAFRFDLALRYLQRSPDEIVDVVREGRHYRVLPTTAGLTLVEFSQEQDENESAIVARVLTGETDSDTLVQLVDRLYPTSLHAASSNPVEALEIELRNVYRGLPVVQTLTPWEALVWAVIGQQINIAFAYRLKRNFVESFGAGLRHEGEIHHAFPTPERVADLDHERDLRPLQFSRQKSRYIIAAARAVLEGSLDFERIATLDDDAASQALQQQLGIGRWTAEYILLRGFARLDVIPAGDAALKALVGQYLALERSATEEEVRSLAERWKPWRGEMGFMLWFAKHAGFFDG